MRELILTGLMVLTTAALGDVLICDCEDAEVWEGQVTASTEQVKEGSKALRWHYAEAGVITLRDIPSDWTSQDALSFWIYSEKPFPTEPWLIVNGKAEAGVDQIWVMADLNINFSGWQRFIIPFTEFKRRAGVQLPEWDNIASLAFDRTQLLWRRAEPDPDTVLYIDDIRLITVGCPAPGEGPRMTDGEFFAALDLQRPELASVKAALDKGDLEAAKSAFANHIRNRKYPRWFTEREDRLAHLNSPVVVSRADEYLANEYKMGKFAYKPERRIDWSHNPEAYRQGPLRTNEYNALLNRFHHFNYLLSAYWRTGEDKYAQKMAADMVAWAEDCPMLLFQSGVSPYHYAWQTLNTAARMCYSWPQAIFNTLDSPAYTDYAIITIWKSIYEQTEHLMKWPGRLNHLTSQSLGVYFSGVLNPEFKRARTWRETGIKRLYGQLEREVYPDGLQYELALGYNMGVLRNFGKVLALASINAMQDELPGDYLHKMESMYNYLLYAMMPNGQVPGRNDAYNADPMEPLKKAAAYFPQRQDFLWGATEGAEGQEPPPDSVAFPYSGHYVMRTGWDAHNDLYLMFDAGPFGAAHQHEDKLGFIVYAYGKQLVVEAGAHMYNASEQRKYVLSTRGHNTIRVDGYDQRSYHVADSWVLPYPFEPLDNLWLSEDDFDFAEGRYEHGYGTRASKDVKVAATHTRSILFVKPQYWIITDTVVPEDDNEHSYESIFHLNSEAAGVDDLTVNTRDDAANLHVIAAPVPALGLKLVEGQEEPELQGWTMKNFHHLRPLPTAIYEWKSTGPTRVTYIFYPMPAGETSPVQEIKLLSVTNEQGHKANATALEIRFADGSRHVYCYADAAAGVCRFGEFSTDGRCALVKLDAQGQVTTTWQRGGTGN